MTQLQLCEVNRSEFAAVILASNFTLTELEWEKSYDFWIYQMVFASSVCCTTGDDKETMTR